jgi:hypothetical protein
MNADPERAGLHPQQVGLLPPVGCQVNQLVDWHDRSGALVRGPDSRGRHAVATEADQVVERDLRVALSGDGLHVLCLDAM